MRDFLSGSRWESFWPTPGVAYRIGGGRGVVPSLQAETERHWGTSLES